MAAVHVSVILVTAGFGFSFAGTCEWPPLIGHACQLDPVASGNASIRCACYVPETMSIKKVSLQCRDGNWEGDTPVECPPIPSDHCTIPLPQLNQDVHIFNASGEEWKRPAPLLPPGSKAMYSCEPGYKMSSSPGVHNYPQVCERGRWQGQRLQCIPAKCRKPLYPENGEYNYVSKRDDSPGTTIVFTCIYGFVIVGKEQLTCTDRGVWSDKFPACKRKLDVTVKCPQPYEIKGGDYHYISYIHDLSPGTRIRYMCFNNYELVGQQDLTCTSRGSWDARFPECRRIFDFCSPLRSPPNGFFRCLKGDCTSLTVGVMVRYGCHSGYEPLGRVIVTCEEGGEWSAPRPACIPLDSLGTTVSPLSARGSGPDVDLSTITIVVSTCCSVLGVLVLVMIAVAFQRCQRNARYCRPMQPSPATLYPPPPPAHMQDTDRVALIACVDGMHVPLPTYEEATRGSSRVQGCHPPSYSTNPAAVPPPEYRLVPTHHSRRVGRTDSIRSSPAFRDGAPDHHRNSIITTGSTVTRDNMSEVLGSMDTMNVSDGTSTTATVGTVGSSISNPSIATSHRAMAGSLLSSDGSLPVTEDAPLLEQSDKEETKVPSRSDTPNIETKEV